MKLSITTFLLTLSLCQASTTNQVVMAITQPSPGMVTVTMSNLVIGEQYGFELGYHPNDFQNAIPFEAESDTMDITMPIWFEINAVYFRVINLP